MFFQESDVFVLSSVSENTKRNEPEKDPLLREVRIGLDSILQFQHFRLVFLGNHVRHSSKISQLAALAKKKIDLD